MDTARLNKIRTLLEAQPEDAFLLFALAQELRNQPDLPAAAKAFTQLRQLYPNYVGLYYHLAAVLGELGRDAEVNEVYTTGIEVARSAGDAHAESELKNAQFNWSLEQDGL